MKSNAYNKSNAKKYNKSNKNSKKQTLVQTSAQIPKIIHTDYIHNKQNQEYRMRNLLAGVPENIKKQIQYDDEAAWSFTNQKIANDLCTRLLQIPDITRDTIITDATASVGGNTIPFAQHFAHVNAIELSNVRSAMLKHNIALFGLDNVTIYNDFAQNVLPSLSTDLLFVDPPWAPAGVNYKDTPNGELLISLSIPDGSTEPFEEFLIRANTKWIICKLPTNYNFAHLEAELSMYRVIDKIFHGRPNSSVVYIFQKI